MLLKDLVSEDASKRVPKKEDELSPRTIEILKKAGKRLETRKVKAFSKEEMKRFFDAL